MFLTWRVQAPKLTDMVVHLKPETESRLQELAATTGRAPDELVEDAMAGYLAELEQVRKTLDERYDDIRGGRVQPVDGEEAFNRLRRKSENNRRS
jgi:predicted transcriptional regulator